MPRCTASKHASTPINSDPENRSAMLNIRLTVSITTHGRPVRLPTPGSQRVRISLPPSLSISLSPFRADLARPPLLRADLGPPPPPPSSGGPSRSRPPSSGRSRPSSGRSRPLLLPWGGALGGARAAPPGRGGAAGGGGICGSHRRGDEGEEPVCLLD